MTTINYSDAISHCAFCGLVALSTARQDNKIKNRIAANKFLSNWAHRAIKERRFPSIITPELTSIAATGHKKAVVANVERVLQNIWNGFNSEEKRIDNLPQKMNDRISNAFNELKISDWSATYAYEQDWSKGGFKPNGLKNVFIIKDHAELFDKNGQLSDNFIHVFIVLPPTSNKEATKLKMEVVDALYKHGILVYSPQTCIHERCHQYLFEIWPFNKKPNELPVRPS